MAGKRPCFLRIVADLGIDVDKAVKLMDVNLNSEELMDHGQKNNGC